MMRRTRIAIVDDNRAFLHAVGRVLATSLASLHVELASTVDITRSQTFDMLVLAACLPGPSVIETCRTVRASQNAMTLVVASADMTRELALSAIQAGANFTLHKPFEPDALIDIVRRVRSRTDQRTRINYRSALIAENLELARRIASKLGRRYRSVIAEDDIESLGLLGLCEAASRFDPSRGEPFRAFAMQRIRGAVLDELRRQSLVSRYGYERKRKVDAVRHAIRQSGLEPTDEHVAAQLGLRVADVRGTLVELKRVPESELASVAVTQDTPASHVERAQVLAHLADVRKTLAPLEATVIAMRYDQGMSIALIAMRLELTTARVAKILAQGLGRMRDAFDVE